MSLWETWAELLAADNWYSGGMFVVSFYDKSAVWTSP